MLNDLKLELEQELAQESYEEALRDKLYENRMRTDYEFALGELGADKITEMIEELKKQLSEYGYEVSYQELISDLI